MKKLCFFEPGSGSGSKILGPDGLYPRVGAGSTLLSRVRIRKVAPALWASFLLWVRGLQVKQFSQSVTCPSQISATCNLPCSANFFAYPALLCPVKIFGTFNLPCPVDIIENLNFRINFFRNFIQFISNHKVNKNNITSQ